MANFDAKRWVSKKPDAMNLTAGNFGSHVRNGGTNAQQLEAHLPMDVPKTVSNAAPEEKDGYILFEKPNEQEIHY